jgi:hypothetical protein
MAEPRKPRKASWRELPPAEMAAHLLATPTISDGAWTSEPHVLAEPRRGLARRKGAVDRAHEGFDLQRGAGLAVEPLERIEEVAGAQLRP